MPNYKRLKIPGSTYFLTLVTYQRRTWLCTNIARESLRAAIEKVRKKYPFSIDAFVLLPDHFHCLWTLPKGDSEFSTRLRLIKTFVTKHCGEQLNIDLELTASRQKRGEGKLWQRRFWEHAIRNEEDFANHFDYIHYNPVKHGLCQAPEQWPYSSFHRYVAKGVYSQDWGANQAPELPDHINPE